MENNIAILHDYHVQPAIVEIWIENEEIFRRFTNVVEVIEYTDGKTDIIVQSGKIIHVRRDIVMYSDYQKGV